MEASVCSYLIPSAFQIAALGESCSQGRCTLSDGQARDYGNSGPSPLPAPLRTESLGAAAGQTAEATRPLSQSSRQSRMAAARQAVDAARLRPIE
ncbi:g4466 [Coccomyxa elongata]